MPNAGEVARQIAVHEAVCAERWKQTKTRLLRIEIVLGIIVLPLLVSEGSVINVLKGLLGNPIPGLEDALKCELFPRVA